MSVIEVKIYYEDTDCGGVVYHANYLRYFERARTEFYAERGISIKEYMEQGITFAVVRAEVVFDAPARYGDILTITSEIEKVRKVSLVFRHTIRRKGTDQMLVRAKITLGCLNREGKLTSLPEAYVLVSNQKAQ
jgi:acyl-CoA thioester hydrolase